jgi:hypothetical protein
MNPRKSWTFRLALVPTAAIVLFAPACILHGQQPAPAAPVTQAPDVKAAAKPTPTDEMDEFAPKPAPPLRSVARRNHT